MKPFLRQATRIAASTTLLIVVSGATAHAAKLVVGNCANESELRAKLAQLQTGKGGTLKFHCGLKPPPIVLTGGALPLSKKVKIDAGQAAVEISGGNASPIFTIDSSAKVTLIGLKLSHGLNASTDGGAIINLGKLTIERCILTENQALVASGGAIVTYGPLSIRSSELSFNKGANGGALYPRFAAGKTTIRTSSLHDNETTSASDGWGGAILIWDGAAVDIRASGIADNDARTGGGVYVEGATSKLTSFASQWKGNQALGGPGGAIYNQGDVLLGGDDSFSLNAAGHGGAIYNISSFTAYGTGLDRSEASLSGGAIYNTGTATLNESAVTNSVLDSDGDGGGIYNTGDITLFNVTLSGNAAARGGALKNAEAANALATLDFVTVFNNKATQYGGGIDYSFGTVQLLDTIVAGSTQGLNCDKGTGAAGTFKSNGFNLSSDTSCPLDKATDFTNTDPKLGALALNGGPTMTHVPAADSKAIDNGFQVATDIDQRFTDRPQGAACDIGAVERCGPGKPGPLVLLAPEAGATVPPGTVFDWSDSSCSTFYLMLIRAGSSAGPIAFETAAFGSLALPVTDSFVAGQTYAWQVSACVRRRCRTSEWRTFTFANR